MPSPPPSMVFEVTKTIAAYTTDGIAPGGGGGHGQVIRRLSQALGARHRNSGLTRPEDNKAT